MNTTSLFDAPMGDVPGPDGYPVLGNLVEFQRDPFAFRTALAEEYGTVARYRMLNQPVILLSDPADIEAVLVRGGDTYEKGEFFQRQLGRVLGNGILNSEGEFWRRQRTLIQPSFRPERLQEYGEIMTDRALARTDDWTDGERRNVHEDMMAITLEVVASALFGVAIQDRTDVVGEAMDVIMHQSERFLPVILPDWSPTPANRRFKRALARLDDIVYDIIERRAADPGDDVVSNLLTAEDERGRGMDESQVRDEVMTLLLAGHETTALALTYALFLVARHPDVERRMTSELRAVLDGDPPTAADVPDLSYTGRVIREAMRVYPPVHTMVREPTEPVEIGGYRIEAGTPVTMSQWVVHRDDRFYDDPEAFRPDRWDDGLEATLPSYAYFPFGGGRRRCIGEQFATMEATVVLAAVLQRYHLESLTEPPLDLGAAITTRPKEPIEMRVHDRDPVSPEV